MYIIARWILLASERFAPEMKWSLILKAKAEASGTPGRNYQDVLRACAWMAEAKYALTSISPLARLVVPP
jgi:hypothetical protein